jgi:hypothetical protein
MVCLFRRSYLAAVMHVQASAKMPGRPPLGKVIRRVKTVWILVFAAGVLAGCGGGGGGGTITFSGNDEFRAATETVSHDPVECAKDARIFARDALALLDHAGANAAYPADLYYSIIRGDFADFQARRCDPTLLGAPLRRRLTAKQRAALVGYLPEVMAQVVRDGLRG